MGSPKRKLSHCEGGGEIEAYLLGRAVAKGASSLSGGRSQRHRAIGRPVAGWVLRMRPKAKFPGIGGGE